MLVKKGELLGCMYIPGTSSKEDEFSVAEWSSGVLVAGVRQEEVVLVVAHSLVQHLPLTWHGWTDYHRVK